jgi:hypothetical protein
MSRDTFRAFERRAVQLPARISALGGAAVPARLLNLCLAGACIESPFRPTPGSQVRVELDAPDLWQPLVLAARVAWVEPAESNSRIGVAFQFDDARVTGWLLGILTSNAYT